MFIQEVVTPMGITSNWLKVIINVVKNYIDQVQLDCINKLKSVGSCVEMDHVIKSKKRKSVMVKLGITKDVTKFH